MVDAKVCLICQELKSLSDFYKDRTKTDGLDCRCRACETIRKHKYHAENRDKSKAKARKYYLENIDRIKENRRQYRNNNQVLIKARSRVYHRKYRKANSDKTRENNQRARARKASLPATLTTDQWRWLCEQTDQRCIYCGGKSDSLAQEHVIPVKQNGGYTIENIRPACKSCNSKKGAKTPEQAGMKLIEEYESRIQAGLKWKQDKLF